jgi:hypothetical protein
VRKYSVNSLYAGIDPDWKDLDVLPYDLGFSRKERTLYAISWFI